jgi:hypothetical protein
MRSMLRGLLLGTAALALSGCLAQGSIGGRATAINEGAGVAQNRAVLLNLVRASRSEPLYFLAMTRITGSATQDLRLGLPAGTLGPGPPTVRNYTFGGGNTNILDNSTITSFDENLLGSKDFYAGMLAPLNLQDVDLLLHQGFARELIFDLVIEKATITPLNGEPFVIYNDPADDHRLGQFQAYIREAMLHGLTTQTYQAPESDGDKGQKQRLSAHAELCYDRALAAPKARDDFPKAANLCRSAPGVRTSAEASDLTVNLHGQQMQIDVTTRSIFGIFTYLGGMIANGDADRVRLHAYPELPAELTRDAPLLTVIRGGAIDRGCFVGIGYEGERYCVPLDGADNTKKIFNILNALLALKTSPGDLPVIQTVHIAP